MIEDHRALLDDGFDPCHRQIKGQFYTPVRANAFAADRLLIGAADGLYESNDRGDHVQKISNIRVNGDGLSPMAYGARGNPDLLYVGVRNRIYARRRQFEVPSPVGGYPGEWVMGIALDPDSPETAFVVDGRRAFRFPKGSKCEWDDLTKKLAPLDPGTLRSVAFIRAGRRRAVVVGTDNGVFQAPAPDFQNWSRLGGGLPSAPVFQLDYHEQDRLLLAGTLGRGAWTLEYP